MQHDKHGAPILAGQLGLTACGYLQKADIALHLAFAQLGGQLGMHLVLASLLYRFLECALEYLYKCKQAIVGEQLVKEKRWTPYS
jgi:hypothetical protein